MGLAENLDKITEDVVNATKNRGMPSNNTTDTTTKMAAPQIKFCTKFFPINSDEEAANFAMFMNWLLAHNKHRKMIREESNWTKDGELIRVIDFVVRADDASDYQDFKFNDDAHAKKRDIFREPPLPETHKGEKFEEDDFVGE